MIMEYINTHTHTGLTGHGNGTIAEVVQAAREAGISILALTEHFPLSRKVDPDNFVLETMRTAIFRASIGAASISSWARSTILTCGPSTILIRSIIGMRSVTM